MAYKSRVSDAVVRRLPMYYRHLRELEKAGVVRISSQELGERMNLTASQIRQDINCFGGFGQQGYGYHVANLKERIGEILGLNHEYHVIIIGAGNIGRAVANYTGFAKEGFNVQAMFDVSPALVGQFGLISSFTTTTTKDKDRNNNIEISAAALNGRMVKPGDTMSFNDCTGQRTGEKGYREAGAIAGGVLVDDTGGGVCQTSSTLFNAVVRADLEIVKRSAHSWPSSYVNKGEDATVNWPSLDFVFRNNGDYPVFVIAWYENQTVTVQIYGKLLPNGQTVDLESEVIKTIKPDDAVLYTLDASLPVGTRKAGRKKRTGYVVDTYKVYKDASGNVTEKKKLWTTTYRAMQDEILYNDGSGVAKE